MKVLFLLLAITLSCCSSDPNPTGVNIDTQINLVLLNSKGRNLLNPSTPGHFSADSIKLFYLTNVQIKEVYQPNLTYPRNFFLAKNESNGEYFMRVFLNEGTNELIGDSTTTYIQWSPTRVDTVNAIMSKTSNVTSTEKVWINGEIKNTIPILVRPKVVGAQSFLED